MSEPVASPPPDPLPAGEPELLPPGEREPLLPGPVPPDPFPADQPDLRPAEQPEPIYPAAVHLPHAHRTSPAPASQREGRPLVERLGMAAIALAIAVFFAAVGVISFGGGQLFLGAMAFLGALMTAWVGLLTLVRG